VVDLAIAAPEPRVRVKDFERIDDYLCAYLNSERFQSAYPLVCRRWEHTSGMLWHADSKDKLLLVGHKARDTMKEFACSVIERRELYPVNLYPTKTLERLSVVIEMHRSQLLDTRAAFLNGLLDYWKVLNDVVQCHEDGASRDHKRLRWEDGRRLVLLTALVMIEVDRSLY
jgi:hypothetical protein